MLVFGIFFLAISGNELRQFELILSNRSLTISDAIQFCYDHSAQLPVITTNKQVEEFVNKSKYDSMDTYNMLHMYIHTYIHDVHVTNM